MRDAGWVRELRYAPETLVTETRLVNDWLKVEIISNDAVDVSENVFVRRLRVRNLLNARREFRIFFIRILTLNREEATRPTSI